MKISPVTGKYVYVDVGGIEYKVFFLENGEGIPLVCQHTAGCHNHQWRYLLEDPDITKNFRVIAYDLPLHGKSDPPFNAEWWKEQYDLTARHFIDFIVSFCQTLELENPVFIGASMAGCIALHLAYEYPDYFKAVIGLEGADYTPGLYNDWFAHSHVHSAEVCSCIATSVMAPVPLIPERDRRLTSFYYSQGAPGILKGDLYFYSVDHDMRETVHKIDTKKCPVFMLTGEYDYLTTPQYSKATADKIPGAEFIEMKGVGHFPMSENHETLKKYIMPVLGKIREIK
jgi:pimeloyl-ACP methyl ester carboxylesterase